MCSPVTCRTCGKTTWSGCGQHVASVKARVPASQWCDGHANRAEHQRLGHVLQVLRALM